MNSYKFSVYVSGSTATFNIKIYEVRAPNETIARGLCRGQCAVNGWKLHDIRLLSA